MFWPIVYSVSGLVGLIGLLAFPASRSASLSRRGALAGGVAWVALVSVEYWIAGPWSFLLKEVEVDFNLPMYTFMIGQGQGLFGWGFAGGQDIYAMSMNTGQYLSLERGLIATVPLWLANAFHEILIPSVCVIGAYLAGRRLFGAPRAAALAVACLFSVSHESLTQYSWTSGLGYPLIPLVAYLFVGRQGHRLYWTGVVLVSLLHAVSMSPTHSFVALVPAVLVASMLVGVRSLPRCLAALAVMTTAVLLNWHESLYAKVLLGPISYRGSVVAPAKTLVQSLETVIRHFPGSMMLALIAVAVILVVRFRDGGRAGAALLLAVLPGPLLVMAPWSAIGLGMLKGFNFLYLADSIVVIAGFIAAAAMAVRPQGITMRVAAGLALFLLCGLKMVNLSAWLSEGGLPLMEAGLRNVKAEASLQGSTGIERSIIVPYRLPTNIQAAAGYDAFDGNFNVYPRDFATYWQKGVMAPVLATTGRYGYVDGGMLNLQSTPIDYKCCDRYSFADYADTTFLRIANVGTVLSVLPLRGEGLEPAPGPEPVPTRNTMPLPQRLRGYLHEIVAPPAPHAYRLAAPLPRVYAASGAEIIAQGSSDEAFLAAVRRQAPLRAAVIRAEDAGPLTGKPIAGEGPAIAAFRQDCDSMVVDLKEGGNAGLVIFNINPTPFWQATTDEAAAVVVPVNMVHMAVPVPAGTNQVKLTYARPMLRQRIAAILGFPSAELGACSAAIP